MTDSPKNTDLKSINDLELRDQLQQWLISQDFTSSIQSKLRKDLYESFAKTTLGRRITFEQQQNQQINFSPKILALNTLVAEFLYSQNCHYTLSVFVSETPHKSSLPNFENHSDFRFSSTDINEIFNAFGLKSTDGKSIQNLYETIRKNEGIDVDGKNAEGSSAHIVIRQNSVNSSLLYCLLQCISQFDGKSNQISTDDHKNNKTQPSPPNKKNKTIGKILFKKPLPKKLQTSDSTSTAKQTITSNHRSEHLNKRFHHTQKIIKYLKSMSHNLVRMTKSIGNLAIVNPSKSLTATVTSTPTPSPPQPQKTAAKLIILSQNLGKISQNMKKLYQSIKKNKNFTKMFLPNLNKMTEVMKICQTNLEKLVNTNSVGGTTNVGNTNRRRQAPSDDCLNCDGINKKQCHEHSFDVEHQPQNQQYQNIDLKIELEQQKNKMNFDFSIKLQQMRTIMKLYYKQKMLEKYRRAVQRAVDIDKTKKTNEMKLIDEKINDILIIQQQLQQQQSQQEQPQQQQQQPQQQQQQPQQQPQPQLENKNIFHNEYEYFDYIHGKQELSVIEGPNINISPFKLPAQTQQQENMLSSNELPLDLGPIRNSNDTNQIRSRLAEIESEGERLENSLKQLKQYNGIGLQLDSNAVDIWKTYNLDRQLLLNHSNQITSINNNQINDNSTNI